MVFNAYCDQSKSLPANKMSAMSIVHYVQSILKKNWKYSEERYFSTCLILL